MARKKGEIDINIRAEELGLSIENLANTVEAEFNDAIRNAAHGAYAKIIAEAQQKLGSTRKDFMKGLKLSTVGNNAYLITLEGKFSNALEKGWEAYDQKANMLASKKIVEVGSRSGAPWVQRSKKGHKYAHVPIRKKPFAKGGATDLGQLMRKVHVMNSQGKRQKLTQTFKDPSGHPLAGKVATLRGMEGEFQKLEGLTKYQKVYDKKVESIYILYRTVSENGKSWIQPPFKGVHGFAQAEQWLEAQIDEILKTFLG